MRRPALVALVLVAAGCAGPAQSYVDEYGADRAAIEYILRLDDCDLLNVLHDEAAMNADSAVDPDRGRAELGRTAAAQARMDAIGCG